MPAKHNLHCSTFLDIRCSPAALHCPGVLCLPAAGKLEQGSGCFFEKIHCPHLWGRLAVRQLPSENRYLLNLQVTVGCGEVCVFHAGGYNESSNQENSGVPRWEFFIGDRPHAPPVDKSGRRPPIEQVCRSPRPELQQRVLSLLAPNVWRASSKATPVSSRC